MPRRISRKLKREQVRCPNPRSQVGRSAGMKDGSQSRKSLLEEANDGAMAKRNLRECFRCCGRRRGLPALSFAFNANKMKYSWMDECARRERALLYLELLFSPSFYIGIRFDIRWIRLSSEVHYAINGEQGRCNGEGRMNWCRRVETTWYWECEKLLSDVRFSTVFGISDFPHETHPRYRT